MVRTIFLKLAKNVFPLLLVLHLKCEKLGLCVTKFRNEHKKMFEQSS